ncbi:MAG: glycoside hydrolase family 140 protein [Bacteroidales bacterium]|nr:glycoside hydrolase family 140 protein [Bacteroidales bacterium]MBN2764104.1 glycoside hydrolase family 140 protein [Bacteroidales bacterium]
MKKYSTILIIIIVLISCTGSDNTKEQLPLLKISDNHRFLADENNKPFFWLGDTGWLLFKKLNREDAEKYLENRKRKGFNVIQVMVLHDLDHPVNIYGDSAFVCKNVAIPCETTGYKPDNEEAYDFWDHTDYIISLAAEKGLYMALVPVWGSNVKSGDISSEQASAFGAWIAKRYRDRKNIIWLNGGDINGNDSTAVWKALGKAIRTNDPNHLITFHPRGRLQSSMWFHDEEWLDFNMIQSGHRRYDQDDTELAYGEDNWRYVISDYKLQPVKPTIDGEPSYEGIPQGLHDTLQPYWNHNDVRRYAYWSVFSGAFGFTYGHNAVMQFHRATDTDASYGPKVEWETALNEPGAQQMIHLKQLMLSRDFFSRVPDQSIIAYNQGERYDYLAATRGDDYAFIYNYTGRKMDITMGKIRGKKVRASWFNPRDGSWQETGTFINSGKQEFQPPAMVRDGNDWVLVLDSVE